MIRPLPAGALIAACQSTPCALPSAILSLLTEDHAMQVALIRLHDSQRNPDPLAQFRARWAGDADRRARRIRVALREAGHNAAAERMGLDAYGIVAAPAGPAP